MPAPSRRDVLKLLGGSLAGIFLTPLPWKLLDDTAIMTQTGPWIAKIPHGPISIRHSSCTLCPAACGIRAHCVNGIPFKLSGVPNHPLSSGMLCIAGLAAHHSAFHPYRFTAPLRIVDGSAASSAVVVRLEDVKAEVIAALSERHAGDVAVLDLNPGRTVSLAYRRVVQTRANARYVIPRQRTDQIVNTMSESPVGPVGFDVRNAKLVVSFGTPLLEIWGRTGNNSPPTGDRRQTIIQVETRRSRSAILADEWIPIKPMSEFALAFGLAREIVRNGWFDEAAFRKVAIDATKYFELIAQYTPERVAGLTGVPTETSLSLARRISGNSPSLFVVGDESGAATADPDAEMAIIGLNVLVGNFGNPGGVMPRTDAPVAGDLEESQLAPVTELRNIPDHSLRLLIIDDPGTSQAPPWEAVERKLSPHHALVVCLSPYLTGIARRADFLVPTPAPLEAYADSQISPFAVRTHFALSPPLISPPKGMTDPVGFVGSLFSAGGSSVEFLKARVGELYSRGEGTIFSYGDGSTKDVNRIGSAGELWSKLAEGGLWIQEPKPAGPDMKIAMLGRDVNGAGRMLERALGPERIESPADNRFPLTLVPFTYALGGGTGQVTPMMSKVYQESALRLTSDTALIDPETARVYDLEEGDIAALETAIGTCNVNIAIDPSSMPGMVMLPTGPDPVSINNDGIEISPGALSTVGSWVDCAWKPTPAILRKG